MGKEHTLEEEMTGIESQRDKDFGVPGNTEDNLLQTLEEGLDNIDEFDSDKFNSTLADKEKFIILPKRELLQFIRAVEPLTKSSVDQYGKSLMIRSNDADSVELLYLNPPFRLAMKINNKSQKMIDPFCMNVSTFKKLCADTAATIVIVQEDKSPTEVEYSTTVCDSLLFLETVPLSKDEYKITRKEMSQHIDRELGLYNFKKIGSILSYSDRTSDKVIVIKGNDCYYNTGIFSARIKSPLSEATDLLIYKSSIDTLGVLMELSKVDIRYQIHTDENGIELMCVEVEGLIYCELPVSKKIEDHYSVNVAKSLKFDASVIIANDSISKLFAYVKSFDYLSDIVTIKFTEKEMIVCLQNQNMTKASEFKFAIVDGELEQTGEMKVSADVMKPYTDITGTNVKYAFNDVGLCMTNDNGNFIVRRTN